MKEQHGKQIDRIVGPNNRGHQIIKLQTDDTTTTKKINGKSSQLITQRLSYKKRYP